MSVALPKVVDYSEPMYSLPSGSQNFQVVCNPISGSTFGPSSQIDFDLGSRGFLIPDSLFIRYTITTANAGICYMAGTPVYSVFQRCTTVMNSQTVETINNYNTIANFIVNTTKDVSQKLGEQYSFGFLDVSTPVNNEQTDGGIFAINGSKMVSGPLYCALSHSSKLIPLFLLNGIRITLTLDSIVNCFSALDNSSATVSLPTNFTLSNVELCYSCVDMGSEVQNMVYAMDRVRIKSHTFASSIQTVASGVSGVQNLIFNHKYSSVKALFLNMGGGNRAISANGNMDSYNIANNGDYQFQVAGINYPQRVLSAGNNNGGVLQMLRQAVGSIYDKNNAMSINTWEYLCPSSTITEPITPAKYWVGVSTEKLKVQGSFFTGISTEASPISAIINISTATSQIHNVMLIVNADLIFEIDPKTKQVVIIQ